MIFFGHLGIPLAAARIYEKRTQNPSIKKFLTSIDYRVLLVGALLPDLIDKPIYFEFHSRVGTSQSYGHSLVFLIIMFSIGLIFNNIYHKPFMLTLAIGVFAHQLLDFVAMNYKNFLWPLFGFGFIPGEFIQTNLISKIIRDISDPYYLAGELIGLPIVAYYAIKVFKAKKMRDFIKYGKIGI